jgi:preprotein translocase subunit Sec63
MLVRKTDSFNQHARISELGNASTHLIAQDLSSETEIKQWVSKNNFKKEIDDFYELLQVTDTATEDDLRKSFEKLMSELEIDEESKNDEIYTKTQKIKLAYEVLMDERMRKNYDKIRNRDKNMQ